MGESARTYLLCIWIDPDDWLSLPTWLKRKLRFHCMEEDVRQEEWIRFTFTANQREIFEKLVLHLVKGGYDHVSDRLPDPVGGES